MPQSETVRDSILDAAEVRARASGYSGFSFREIAADVGIKSASVHYHFPTKADLAHELMDRYRTKAMEFLGEPADVTEGMARLVELFQMASRQGEMCLCGALGAASASLPMVVQHSAASFSDALIQWLEALPAQEHSLPFPAPTIVALLEGALLLSVTAKNPDFFDNAIAPLAIR